MIELSTVLVLAGIALILCGVGVTIMQLRPGETGIGLLRGGNAETRRAVRRAIREGETEDPGVDRLARAALQAMVPPRWARYLFATMLALAVLLLATGSHTVTDIAVRTSQVLLWSGLLVLNVVNQRRFDNYRGLRPVRADRDTTSASDRAGPA
ncbi:hypothetical protein [Actinoplanes xinjiangensis]|uniref:Uncharacterized protein n=1 Tax=Actinoplanes xinjiangensis TaxID=512350 RepID=A0A316FKB4_9ACTN|nr:hypothetical protein [Actinoplanes xinjiangensis]PWK48929.1 hypothetical protein BC793_105280 [Actinoplanes xinjiangensis]GIF38635.1 hypothetical protein Axi01nite_29460 [Actinoplanes xinjiangensis]